MNSKYNAQASNAFLALGLVYMIAAMGLGRNGVLLGAGAVFFIIGLANLARGR